MDDREERIKELERENAIKFHESMILYHIMAKFIPCKKCPLSKQCPYVGIKKNEGLNSIFCIFAFQKAAFDTIKRDHPHLFGGQTAEPEEA